jgi:hypothetical protein
MQQLDFKLTGRRSKVAFSKYLCQVLQFLSEAGKMEVEGASPGVKRIMSSACYSIP